MFFLRNVSVSKYRKVLSFEKLSFRLISLASTNRHKKLTSTNNNGGSSEVYKSAEFTKRLQAIKHVFDLREPSQFYPEARSLKRRIIYHAGPTNSGKTHQALQRFFEANNGMYCGPLRMLAAEINHKTNAKGVPCDMITGEERIWAVNKDEPSNHLSCTVEMCSVHHPCDVAIIDEVQMLRDPERGWAWTRALLGIVAPEIHVCGEEAGVEIVKKMLARTNDEFEVRHYKRLTKLKVEQHALKEYSALRTGDCVVAFSQKRIYDFRKFIEEKKGWKCSVVYGKLPSNIRLEQAQLFNQGRNKILIASDAIGMGMNLNIQRIVFSSLSKFDGNIFGELSPHHTKQIAGRAGRFKSKYKTGYVTTLKNEDLPRLSELMDIKNSDIKKAGILPSLEQFELLSLVLPEKSLTELTEVFEILMKLDRNYIMCDVEKFKLAASELEHIPLKLQDSYTFAIAPVNISREIVLPTMIEFAWCVVDQTPVTIDEVKEILRWPPRKKPKSLRALQRLECIHETLDLYRWLSYRFEEIFVDRDGVTGLQMQLEQIISRAVTNNMKYSDNKEAYKRFLGRRNRKRRKR